MEQNGGEFDSPFESTPTAMANKFAMKWQRFILLYSKMLFFISRIEDMICFRYSQSILRDNNCGAAKRAWQIKFPFSLFVISFFFFFLNSKLQSAELQAAICCCGNKSFALGKWCPLPLATARVYQAI